MQANECNKHASSMIVLCQFNRAHLYMDLGHCFNALEDLTEVHNSSPSQYLSTLLEFCRKWQHGLSIACKDMSMGIRAIVSSLDRSSLLSRSPLKPSQNLSYIKQAKYQPSHFEEDIQLLVNALPSGDLLRKALQVGLSKQQQAKFNDALRELQHVQSMVVSLPFRQQFIVSMWKAQLQVSLKEYDEAISGLAQIVSKPPTRIEDGRVLKYMGTILHHNVGKSSDALECYNEAVNVLMKFVDHDQQQQRQQSDVKKENAHVKQQDQRSVATYAIHTLLNRADLLRSASRYTLALRDYRLVLDILGILASAFVVSSGHQSILDTLNKYSKLLEHGQQRSWSEIQNVSCYFFCFCSEYNFSSSCLSFVLCVCVCVCLCMCARLMSGSKQVSDCHRRDVYARITNNSSTTRVGRCAQSVHPTPPSPIDRTPQTIETQ